jgi:hypothetical protein
MRSGVLGLSCAVLGAFLLGDAIAMAQSTVEQAQREYAERQTRLRCQAHPDQGCLTQPESENERAQRGISRAPRAAARLQVRRAGSDLPVIRPGRVFPWEVLSRRSGDGRARHRTVPQHDGKLLMVLDRNALAGDGHGVVAGGGLDLGEEVEASAVGIIDGPHAARLSHSGMMRESVGMYARGARQERMLAQLRNPRRRRSSPPHTPFPPSQLDIAVKSSSKVGGARRRAICQRNSCSATMTG